MVHRVVGLLALVVAGSGVMAQTPLVGTVNAGRGSVPVYRPSDYTPGEPLPLIVALHGFQQDGPEVESYFKMVGLVESERFLYCVPSGKTNFLGLGYWNDESACCDLFDANPDDSTYLTDLVELVQTQYAVNERSIHFVGYSNGGFMSYRMACEHADLIASIVSLAGATPIVGSPCNPSNPVSVLQVHGTSDGTIFYTGGTVPLGGDYPSAPQSVETWALVNGCDPVAREVGVPFDLATSVSGAETTARVYDLDCEPGYEAELWTMAGADHGPPFVGSPAGDGTSNAFSARVVEWMLAHPKPGGVECVADTNDDGIVDNGDIVTFIALFLAADPTADVNGDGILDNGDIGVFVELFLAGC